VIGEGRIHWYYDTLTPKMAAFAVVANVAISAALDQAAQEVQEYAQANASWEDRSGVAREGLTAEANSDGFHHEIVLYHTAEYGIWLEIRWNGRYAIIMPTLEHMGPLVMASLTMEDF
jgi:hypothetical protein